MIDVLLKQGESIREKLETCLDLMNGDEANYDACPPSKRLMNVELDGWIDSIRQLLNSQSPHATKLGEKFDRIYADRDSQFSPGPLYPNTMVKRYILELEFTISVINLLYEVKNAMPTNEHEAPKTWNELSIKLIWPITLKKALIVILVVSLTSLFIYTVFPQYAKTLLLKFFQS